MWGSTIVLLFGGQVRGAYLQFEIFVVDMFKTLKNNLIESEDSFLNKKSWILDQVQNDERRESSESFSLTKNKGEKNGKK